MVGQPVGGPIVEGEEDDGAWDEGSEGGADLESDADDDEFTPNVRRNQPSTL